MRYFLCQNFNYNVQIYVGFNSIYQGEVVKNSYILSTNKIKKP